MIKEKSPYLLQHAHNPVEWYPWGEEAFAKAKQENKPVFLSIGYSTCHWCHVMEKESFENQDIAKLMNDCFVAIKVDREERPDIDATYMNAVTAMTGQGGWPLSVFLTPEKMPFYGGTYFPPEPRWGSVGFKDLLQSVYEAWLNKQDQILKASQSITSILKERYTKKSLGRKQLTQEILKTAYQQFEESFDSQYGGFGYAPKFPMGHNLSFLLSYWLRTREERSLEMVKKTLTAMAQGGIYDQIGGGFHRYSTDPQWQIPHFEKMLYDQAILAKIYLEGYQATGNEFYGQIGSEVLDYVLRDLQNKEGGFFCAEDADSLDISLNVGESSENFHEKKEGAFYLWRWEDLKDLVDKETFEIMSFHFGIEKNGNAQYDPHGEFVGKNVLSIAHDLEETADHFKKLPTEIHKIIRKAKEKLIVSRQKRPRPHLDDKILVDWNGLTISSLALGYMVLNKPQYLQAAERATQFIFQHLMDEGGRLYHRYRDGQGGILGTLDDFAFFIHGLLDLYFASFQVEYLRKAILLSKEMIRLFWDDKEGGFFLTPCDGEELIVKQKEIYDGAIPSGNSFAALVLVRLYHLTQDQQWLDKLQRLFETFVEDISIRPSAYTQLLIAYDFLIGPVKEFVVVAERESNSVKEIFTRIHQHFIPHKVIVFCPLKNEQSKELEAMIPLTREKRGIQGQTTIYVCENHVCHEPLTDLKKLAEILN